MAKAPTERQAVRQELSAPLVEELQVYMREQRAKLSRGHDLAKAIELYAQALGRLHPIPR